jgi:hypothetical protein
MIAEHIPLTVEELAKQVELLQGSFDFWWWVWTLAISWLLLKMAKASAVTGLDLAEKPDHLSARLEAAERQIENWKRIMPR